MSRSMMGYDIFCGKSVPAMLDLVCIIENNIPRFVMALRKNVLDNLSLDAPLIEEAQKRFDGLGSFVNNPRALGYNGTFSLSEDSFGYPDEFKVYKTNLPNDVIGKQNNNWIKAWRISCTLQLLFMELSLYDEHIENPNKICQLLSGLLACYPEMNGSALSITVSPVLRNYIETHRELVQKTAIETMALCFNRMWPQYFSGEREIPLICYFGVRPNYGTDNSGFVMDIPGNACGLYVDGMKLEDGPGWELESHNVDSPVQQLTLIAGIASIARLYRVEPKSKSKQL